MGGLPTVLGGRWVLCCKDLRSIYVMGFEVVGPLFLLQALQDLPGGGDVGEAVGQGPA